MNLLTKAVRGTQDLLPSQSYKRQYVERTFLEVAGRFGYPEARSPVFEHTELFQRSVGNTTDVVQKEMYTFEDKGGRSITLRPEGTAGMVRLLLENGLYNEALPQKLCYVTSCYRYEKPQAGRLREFHQFGVECFGTAHPAADVEVIAVAHTFFQQLGVQGIRLEINSIGCPQCRSAYHAALRAYFEEHKGELCATCLDRLERNPMRILDCKSEVCAGIAAKSPVILDYLCEDCQTHFAQVGQYLQAFSIEFSINPRIVRGLDYYTRTVFEFIAEGIGTQGTVCGGGRYDGLMEELGGPHLPSLGFGMGIERLIMLMENQGANFPPPPACQLYLANIGVDTAIPAAALIQRLRRDGIVCEGDVAGRSLKAQMKYADKLGARFTAVLGEAEMESGVLPLKDMCTGEKQDVKMEMLSEWLLGQVAPLPRTHS